MRKNNKTSPSSLWAVWQPKTRKQKDSTVAKRFCSNVGYPLRWKLRTVAYIRMFIRVSEAMKLGRYWTQWESNVNVIIHYWTADRRSPISTQFIASETWINMRMCVTFRNFHRKGCPTFEQKRLATVESKKVAALFDYGIPQRLLVYHDGVCLWSLWRTQTGSYHPVSLFSGHDALRSIQVLSRGGPECGKK